ncbi:MAG: thiol:disulfide interchange protein [Methylocystis sp.]|nr:MAG: thiol:disulfide interchange protein [Methylocystis sp.]
MRATMTISGFPTMSDKIMYLSRRLVLFGLVQGFAAAPAHAELDAPPMLQTNSSQFIEMRPRAMAPQVVLHRIDGKSIPLAASRGKVVLLSFWATWCPPCRRELPALERAQKAFDSTKLAIAAVSVDTADKATIEGFLNRLGVKHLHVFLDPGGRIAERANRETGAPFPLYGMPITYVIDRSGTVVGYITGEVDWLSPEATAFLNYFIDG